MILPLLIILATTFSAPAPLSADAETGVLQNPQTLGAYVRQYYADTPILADIAWCESRIRQWDKEGNVFRGAVNHFDVGVMQINTLYHEEKAVDLDMDLYTLSGNLAYAKHLYDKEGTKPWASSEACWGKVAVK
ncbi:hypothetical protein HY090_01445 [Candidatus Kaiserbacteria bacterium]|nr:hypothetical protein [Candidatus Kaiserbacteria bacterium]